MKRSNKLLILLGVLLVCCVLTIVVLKTEKKKELIRTTDEVVLEVDPDSVDQLSWSYDEVSLAFRKEDGHWIYESDEAFPADDEKIAKLLEDFKELGATFIIDDVEDFSQYGLDKPVCTIRLATDKKKDYTVQLGAYSTMDAQRYVTLGDGRVFLVKSDPMDDYGIELADLIKYDEMPEFDHVTAIRFRGAQNYSIFREEGSDRSACVDDIYYADMNGEILPLDTEEVDRYLRAISSMYFTKFRSYNMTEEEKVAFGQDDPQLIVEVDYSDKDEDGELGEPQTFQMRMGRDLAEKTTREEAEKTGDSLANLIVTAYVTFNDSNIVYSISDESCTRFLASGYNDLRHKAPMPADFNATLESFEATLDGETYAFTSELPEKGDRDFFFDGEEFNITAIRVRLKNIAVDEFTDEKPTGREEISMLFRLNAPNYPEIRVAAYRYDGVKCLVTVNGEPFGFTKRANVVELREAVLTTALGGAETEED